jgi:hypothetical protein
MKVMITQYMFFPWVGLLEQIKLADIIVHYDDVQFSKGGFTNRVQVKTSNGTHWMTVPMNNFKLGLKIEDIDIHLNSNWKSKHLALLDQSFKISPYKNDALDIVRNIYLKNHIKLAQLARDSMMEVANYYGILDKKTILNIKELGVSGSGSSRVLEIVKKLGGSTYITGHGARNYLDHQSFLDNGINVEYINYKKTPYSQPWGDFTPYVTSLDLIANMGKNGINFINSDTIDWRLFV